MVSILTHLHLVSGLTFAKVKHFHIFKWGFKLVNSLLIPVSVIHAACLILKSTISTFFLFAYSKTIILSALYTFYLINNPLLLKASIEAFAVLNFKVLSFIKHELQFSLKHFKKRHMWKTLRKRTVFIWQYFNTTTRA